MVEIAHPTRDYSSRVAENRACPGVFMFNASMKVLWAERRAWELCRSIADDLKEGSRQREVPTAIKELGRRALTLLESDTKKTLDSPVIRKIVKGARGSLLVCGFGLPNTKDSQRSRDPEQSRLLILVERIGRREEAAALQAREIFRLTQREVQVVQHLLKGWSNKEIAYELHVSEQTVKEHLQRVMAKTKTSSRTGILARVLFL
jgi:DNA-binding CsgD family transcriptional regulator